MQLGRGKPYPLCALPGAVSGAVQSVGGAASCFLCYTAVAYFHIMLHFYQMLLGDFYRHDMNLDCDMHWMCLGWRFRLVFRIWILFLLFPGGEESLLNWCSK